MGGVLGEPTRYGVVGFSTIVAMGAAFVSFATALALVGRFSSASDCFEVAETGMASVGLSIATSVGLEVSRGRRRRKNKPAIMRPAISSAMNRFINVSNCFK